VTLIAMPIILVVIFATLVGIPLAVLLGAVFIIYLYLARIYAMLAIGTKISEWTKFKTSTAWLFIFGLIAYYLLTLVPIIGGLVKLVVLSASVGAAVKNDRLTWASASKVKLV
jgi:hypothetical protein